MTTGLNALQSSISRLGRSLDEHKKGAVPMDVELQLLHPYQDQARTSMDEPALQELAATIKEVGILSPILVRPGEDGRYEIIAGERRWRAAKIAGLAKVPVLVKALDDETVDKIHLYENIHRENLNNIDLAARVQKDVEKAGGSLQVVAEKYGKQKSWVSKLVGIAQGGELMGELVRENVTADRAVLATVSSLERKSPEQAKVLVDKLKAAPEKADKRAMTTEHARAVRVAQKKPVKVPGVAPAVPKDALDASVPVERKGSSPPVITVELSPLSSEANEFVKLVEAHGSARLSSSYIHPDSNFAVVEFGPKKVQRRSYLTKELQLLTVA